MYHPANQVRIMHDAVVVVRDPKRGHFLLGLHVELSDQRLDHILFMNGHIVVPVWPRVLVEETDGMRYLM